MDDEVLLSGGRASTRQRHAALLVAIVVLAAFIATAPIAQVRLPRFPGIILIQNTLTFLNDTLTAVLLFGHYAVSRERALCVLASGFLFTALIAVAHALSFPEVFSPTGLLRGGSETPWLYTAWHTVLPLSIVAYAFDRSVAKADRAGSAAVVSIVLAIAAVVCLAFAGAWIITEAQASLPRLVDGGRLLPPSEIAVAMMTLATAAAFWAVAIRKRPTVLDIWLMVLMFTWLCTICLVSLLSAERYDAGWYVGRVFEVLTSIVILSVFICEIVVLYARSHRAAAVNRRERERRIGEMESILAHVSRVNEAGRNSYTLIHEITQPLAAISMLAQTGARAFDKQTDVRERLIEPLAEQSARAIEIVQQLREFLRGGRPERRIHQISKLIDDAVRLAALGEKSGLVVETRYHPTAETVFCNRVEIEQVAFNLVRNAMEAMAGRQQRILRISTDCSSEGMLEISIADNGPGLSAAVREKLFQPFVTTKAGGLGVGLSICQLIIQAHGGQLQARDNPGGGTIFAFTLPQAPPDAQEGAQR